ncbi:MAG TPA: TonB-dependent receptor [Vicinamibacterales bacterium]|nr:TonB-dependent receptor [Vicinamibacterales bacterium]
MANRSIAKAVRIALVTAAAAGGGLYGTMSAAQQEIAEVVVTGTRVTNANLLATSPITQIDAEDFAYSGTTRVEDLLNSLPQLAPSFDSFTVNPTTGFATADLRGLGSFRTLVLVNGHRLQPGGIRSEARDLNQIPAALVKRVEVLTGGASAVYGSDAVAGVVNFILDTEFEGASFSTGLSGYQHDNSNKRQQALMDLRGFSYPTGDKGLDGRAYHAELALGSKFADGAGHAMAYFTWRENDELLQGDRDYSSCALNGAGTACGGSATAPDPTFIPVAFDGSGTLVFPLIHIEPDNSWALGSNTYNYAPINHYQRPDERWTFGGALSYEVSPYFKPYVETMFANTNTEVQIAESGTFFVNFLELDCASPLVGSMCSDLGFSDLLGVYVGKRNVEGGPRISAIESSSFRVVTGAKGELSDNWDYDASFLYGRTTSNEANINDFLRDRVGDALLQCPPGSFSGCIPYNVWEPGGVTAEAAAALAGTGSRQGATELRVANAFVTGALPFTLPWAQEPISLVAGLEWRKDTFIVRSDSNMQTNNFTGLGGPRLPVDGTFDASEVFLESGIPLIQDAGILETLALDLGYRWSDYNTSGGVETWKAGLSAQFGEMVRLRGGLNRAIRAANVQELFRDQQISLWQGTDPCAGATPAFTEAECANTGVTAAQYGNISFSPASQYNQHSGGNPLLDPEKADTFTIGVVVTPLDRLNISVDYWDIEITERIGTIGASTVLQFCGTTGDAFLCDKVRRNPVTGDLWLGSDLETSGFVENLDANFGDLHWRGIDLSTQYSFDLLGGTLNASLIATRNLEQEVAPLPGVNPDATYDCAGVINISCSNPAAPDWRHTMRLSYSLGAFTGMVRWRYVGELDYRLENGIPGTVDRILLNNGGCPNPLPAGSNCVGKLDAQDYFDLSVGVDLFERINVIVGISNVLDEEPPLVGADLALNANSPGGYDAVGRFVHATLKVRF